MSSNLQWRKLKFYIYAYVDPRTNEIFYIGKGKNKRAEDHLTDKKESNKVARINELRKLGLKPRIELVRHGIESNKEAERIESSCIDIIGVNNLTNEIRGKGSKSYGRKTLDEVAALISLQDIKINDPVMVIIINKTFYYGIDELSLYEITRGFWNRLPRSYNKAKYALAVYKGVVQEVYEIAGWFEANSTQYFVRKIDDNVTNRKEFVGKIANDEIRTKYKYKCVTNDIGRNYGWSTRGFNLD